jgi:enamine deaminase RidA (YjgF/YER057c/UK114 family)
VVSTGNWSYDLGRSIERVTTFASPEDLPAPAGYSHVVTIPAGPLVWTAGQVAMSADGVVPDGWEAQPRLAFENVGRALAAAGAGWNDVVKLTFYVVSTDHLATVRAIRDEFVNTAGPPTSSLVRVAGLFRPDVLIEIEAVATLAR